MDNCKDEVKLRFIEILKRIVTGGPVSEVQNSVLGGDETICYQSIEEIRLNGLRFYEPIETPSTDLVRLAGKLSVRGFLGLLWIATENKALTSEETRYLWTVIGTARAAADVTTIAIRAYRPHESIYDSWIRTGGSAFQRHKLISKEEFLILVSRVHGNFANA